MITSIHIRGFKSLLDEKLDLGAVNVFIGANGSGKSNILEAVGVLSAAVSGRVDDESLQRRGVRPGLPRLYKSSFAQKRTYPEIFLEAETETNVQYSVGLQNPIEYPSHAWKYKTEKLKVGQRTVYKAGVRTGSWLNKEIGLAVNSLANSEENSSEVQFVSILKDYGIFTPNTPVLRGTQPDAIKGAVGLMGGGLAESIAKLQKDQEGREYYKEALALLDWVEDIESVTNASLLLSPSVPRQKHLIVFKDRYMAENRNKLTAFDASEGALYVLFALVLARAANAPAFFAVDNFDQALNPRLVKELVKYFCRWMLINREQPRQALLTVHNPTALDGLPINDERVRLFTVDRNNTGHTKIKRVLLTPEIRAIAQEQNLPLSQLWLMGHLGGMPNV